MEQTPITDCIICDRDFQPAYDHDFICRDCRGKLKDCPNCHSDDVVMSWDVGLNPNKPCYYWEIECTCGKLIRSHWHNLADDKTVAQELHAEWMKSVVK